VARHRHLQHFGRTTRKPKCRRHAASRCARIWPGHRSPSQRSACRRAHCRMPRNRRCQRRGAGARVKDALADGAMSGCCIGLVRRCALAGRHGLRFEGSRLNHCDHCARGVWRVPRQAAGFGRAADAIQRGNLDFMPANPPEDALF
jgi:hypothetical protein